MREEERRLERSVTCANAPVQTLERKKVLTGRGERAPRTEIRGRVCVAHAQCNETRSMLMAERCAAKDEFLSASIFLEITGHQPHLTA